MNICLLFRSARSALVLPLLGLLAACAGLHDGVPPTGDKAVFAVHGLELKREVRVPAGVTRVFFQRGRLYPHGGFDHYYPHCDLEMETLAGTERKVSPGRFEVTHIQPFWEEVVEWRRGLYAALGLAGMEDDAGQTDISRGYHFWLGRDQGGDGPRRLTCHGAEDLPYRAEYPTLAEVQEALGGFAALLP